MAYDKGKIFEQAKEAIEKNNLFFMGDVVAFLPISRETYYKYFPPESDENKKLREMLELNKKKY